MIEFEILSGIEDIETIATGRGVYIRRYLERTYGKGRWRKIKGIATVQLTDGTICEAEIHWFIRNYRLAPLFYAAIAIPIGAWTPCKRP